MHRDYRVLAQIWYC